MEWIRARGVVAIAGMALAGGGLAEGPRAERFAPGVVSRDDRHEFGSALSRDGGTVYFGVDVGGRSEIWVAERMGETWGGARVLFSDPTYSFNDPFLDAAEEQLYFISDRPRSRGDEAGDTDLWFVARSGEGWTEPVALPASVNSPANEYFVSLTDEGALYFASNVGASEESPGDFDIYRALPGADGFEAPGRLGPAINTRAYEADVFVAPDESYLVFSATRRGGLGRGDLYVSFKGEDGEWLRAVNLGERVNTAGHELCPFVTRDGERLLFTSREDIWSIDAAILEALRP